jgi:voltage-gated potassium channel
MKSVKQYLFKLLEGTAEDDSRIDFYDVLMIVVIILSILPLMFKQGRLWLNIIDWVAAVVFIVDYILRWWTADLKLKRGRRSFVLYPFTPMAVVDLLSIVPAFAVFFPGEKFLRFMRFLRLLRGIRVFKLLPYFRSCMMIRNVIYNQRHSLMSAYTFAVFYIFISALLVFNVEPQTFKTFWDALYWSVVSLTTVGYGDIYPVSGVGRCITVLSAFVGIAIVALPSGIITAGYMTELEKSRNSKQND